jgi:hypothetical protein
VKLRLMLGAAAVIAVAIAALVSPVSAGTRSHTHVTHRWALIDGKRARPAITPRNDPEGSALNLFADRVQTLGMSRYPGIFAGAVLRAGTVDIYAVRQHEQVFLRAVARMDTGGLPYTVRPVAHSWADLLTLRDWIASRSGKLRREGIVLVSWGPDAELNAVQVTFQKPGARQLADLQKTVVRLHAQKGTGRSFNVPKASQVTRRTYQQVATAALNAQIPAGARVVFDPAYSPPATAAADGSADNSPFFGGDDIFYHQANIAECTGGFAVNSASSPSIRYMITAAHCSYQWDALGLEHDWYTCYTHSSSGNCNYTMGAVEAIFWNNNYDFELINATSIGKSTSGAVWQNKTSATWAINGWFDPAQDSLVTFDGWQTGAITDVKVHNANTCVDYDYGNSGTTYRGVHTACNVLEATKNNTAPCKGGDSGGPVLTREGSTGSAEANGTIVATNGLFCWAQLISTIRNVANVRVIFES